MPSQMNLTLKLQGVSQLISAIRRLNTELNRLNNSFKQTAKIVDNAATKLGAAVRKAKGGIPGGKPGGGGGGNSGGNGGGSGGGVNDLSSLFFSLSTGQWKIAFAKLATRAFNNFSKGSGGGANFAGSIKNIGALLTKFAGALLIAAAAIAAVIIAFKVLQHIFEEGSKRIKSYIDFYYKTGGNKSVSGPLKGIATELNMPLEDMASAASGPGMGRTLLHKLEILRGIKDDEAAAQFMRSMGLSEQFAGVRKMTPAQWEKAQSTKSFGNIKELENANNAVNSGLGNLKEAMDQLYIAMAPIIEVIGLMIRGFAELLKGLVAFVKVYLWPLFKILQVVHLINEKQLKEIDKFVNGVNKFNNGIDKFTEKVGTFGGGQRANNALPRGWTWGSHQDQLINSSRNLGALV